MRSITQGGQGEARKVALPALLTPLPKPSNELVEQEEIAGEQMPVPCAQQHPIHVKN